MESTAKTIREDRNGLNRRAETKPRVVMLHGMFGGTGDWSGVARKLVHEWPVHVLSLPVFETPRGMCGLENLLRFLADWLDRREIDRTVLVGNSLGGHLALMAALRWPRRVSGLVLTGSAGLMERGFEHGVPRRPDRKWVRAMVEDVFHDPAFATEKLLDDVSAIVGDRRRVLNTVRMARAMRRTSVRDELSLIACPVTLIWGRQDRVTPPEVAHEFARSLPNADLHFIDSCGHAPPIEKPAEFHRILRATLNRTFA